MMRAEALQPIQTAFPKENKEPSLMTSHHLIRAFVVISSLIFFNQNLWAVYPPEPQSGGRFFAGKGTRAGANYSEAGDYLDASSYGRTERGNFDRHHYAEGVELGAVRVKPSIGYTGEYDSNIFLTQNDRKGDYISKLLGGIDADVIMDDGKYALMGGVQSKSEWFAKHGKEDHTDWAYQLGGEINLQAIQISVFDNFRDTTERTDSELTDRVERYENRLGGLAVIPFGEFFSETEISDFIVDFRDNRAYEPLNRHEFAVYPRLGMNIGGRTQALIEYGYMDINYENQDDRNAGAHQGQIGVRGFLGEADLLAYQLWGGWQFRNYDSGQLNNFSSFVGHGELIYKWGPATRLALQAIRRPEESNDSGQNFYTRNEVNFQVRQQIAEQWFVNGRAGVGFNHYVSDRLDFLWEPAVGIEYVLPGKMLSLFAEYKFSSRESDSGSRDYDRHIANFGIKAQV